MAEGLTFIDASLFMGMHGVDEDSRRACKGFFVERLHATVQMSLEHVGQCDEIVWRHGRAVQDAYYPFMDNLHTVMRIERRGYRDEDLHLALSSPRLEGMPAFERLLLAAVMNRGGTLYTVNPRLLGRPDLPARQPPSCPTEPAFPAELESLYLPSLALRVASVDP